MAQPDPRLADVHLLTLAAWRVQQRRAPARPPPAFPAGWWGAFVRVCCRELPVFGLDILVRLGVPEAEAQALSTMSEADFTAWLGQPDQA